MNIGGAYYPLGQFVIGICFIIILYLNLRKHGWSIKYNQLLTYLVLVVGTVLLYGKNILNQPDWFGVISPFLLAFMFFNKHMQSFRNKVNNFLDGR